MTTPKELTALDAATLRRSFDAELNKLKERVAILERKVLRRETLEPARVINAGVTASNPGLNEASYKDGHHTYAD